MKKHLLWILFTSAVLFNSTAQVKICAVKGVTSVPFTYMVQNPDKYSFEFTDSPEQAVNSMSYGDADCTILSYKAARKLAEASDGKITIAAEASRIDFSVISSRKGAVRQLSDLLGKKVYVEKDSLEESTLRWVLRKYEIPAGSTEGCVQIITDYNSTEIVSKILGGQIQYGVLSGSAKAAAMKRSFSTYEAINLQNEISSAAGTTFSDPLTVLVIRTQLLEENRALVMELLEDFKASINKVKSSPSKAAQLNRTSGMGLNQSFSTYTISSLNLGFRSLIAK